MIARKPALWHKQLRLKGPFRGTRPRGERVSVRLGYSTFRSVPFDWQMRSTPNGGALDLVFADFPAIGIHIALGNSKSHDVVGESDSGEFAMAIDSVVDLFWVADDVVGTACQLLKEKGVAFERSDEGDHHYLDMSIGDQVWLIERLERGV